MPRVWYGLTTPGVGYKIAAGRRPATVRSTLDQPERPVDRRLLASAGIDHVAAGRSPAWTAEPIQPEACIYTMTPDRDFILDTIDGIVVLGGDSGHAFKFGPLLGRLAADLAQARQLPPECEMFRAGRLAGG